MGSGLNEPDSSRSAPCNFGATSSPACSQAFVVVFIVASIVFVVARLVGNPESFLLPYEATDSEIETIREHLGLNDSLIVQYGDFLWISRDWTSGRRTAARARRRLLPSANAR